MSARKWLTRALVGTALSSLMVGGLASSADAAPRNSRKADWDVKTAALYPDRYTAISKVGGARLVARLSWSDTPGPGYSHRVWLDLADTKKNDGKYVRADLRYGVFTNGTWKTHHAFIDNRKGGGTVRYWDAVTKVQTADLHVKVCTVSVKTGKVLTCDSNYR
jgi:hypothetical protein